MVGARVSIVDRYHAGRVIVNTHEPRIHGLFGAAVYHCGEKIGLHSA
jgi:hypothetical protein